MGGCLPPSIYSRVKNEDIFFLKLAFPDRTPSNKQIKQLILRTSDLFTKAAKLRPSNYMNFDEFIKGYLLYFVPVNLNKTYRVLKELFFHPVFHSQKDLKILDIGCGPAPALISVFDLIRENIINPQYLRYVAVESEEKAIDMAKELIEKLKPEKTKLKHEFIKADASDIRIYLNLKQIKPDIVIFSNSLGEILDKGSIRIEDFINMLRLFVYKNHSVNIVFIEPATKKSSIRLHYLRDAVIEELKLYPYSPCLNNLPCPALKANNWCYEERKWKPPQYLNFLSSVGLQINYLKFSYLILRQDRANIRDLFDEGGEIIKNTSHIINEKGKGRIWACWNGELVDLEKLKRDLTEDDTWLKLRKGDYISVDRYVRINKKIRIPRDAKIRILYSPDEF